MTDSFDPAELADEIAAIAHTTRDPDTAVQLMELAARLLGLEHGGGEAPNQWVSDPMCAPA